MNMVRSAVVTSVLAACVVGAMAGDGTVSTQEMVVSATRIATPISQVGSSVTVLTADEIEERQLSTSLDAIGSAINGVHVSQIGGSRQQGNIYVRGAAGQHLLVLVDGVGLNDPMGAGRVADLSNIDLMNVERVEVLRGPQSCLYGSDAMAGVINIVTRRGDGPPTVMLTAEAGSYGTFRGQVDVYGGTEVVHYSVSLAQADSKGFSVANKDNGNSEKDGYEATSASARIDWTPAREVTLGVITRYADSLVDLDSAGMGVVTDTTNDTAKTSQMFSRVFASFDLFDSVWQHTLGVSLSGIERDYDNPTSNSKYDSSITKVDWQHNIYAWRRHVLTFGLDASTEEGEYTTSGLWSDTFDKKSADTFSCYAQDFATFGSDVSVVAGARYDDNENFGSETTYRVAPVVAVGESGVRVKGSVGTGFKAPSLYQMYSPYGSTELSAEKSLGWDAGVEWATAKRDSVLSATWFNNEFTDLIDFDLVNWKYYNVDGKTTTHGLEFEALHHLTEGLSVSAGYTYTKTNKEDTDTELYRRPRDRVFADVVCRFGKGGSVALGAVYVGRRKDLDFASGNDVTLDPYTVVNVRATVRVAKDVELFGRIENLLDEDYEEAVGYGTAGQSFYGGARWTL